jgi:hypothetical protein
VGVYVGIYITNGVVNGWRTAYDVNVVITSPADTSQPWLAWPLSIAGWLIVPVLAGAIAGYAVTSAITVRRRRKADPAPVGEATPAGGQGA